MYIDSKKKKDIFKKFGKGESDTGSAEGQIALFSHRIKHLTDHLKSNKKDFIIIYYFSIRFYIFYIYTIC